MIYNVTVTLACFNHDLQRYCDTGMKVKSTGIREAGLSRTVVGRWRAAGARAGIRLAALLSSMHTGARQFNLATFNSLGDNVT
jgi:hypothetical protein